MATATKEKGASSAEATVTQPARFGSGKVKTENQKDAAETTTDTPQTPASAKKEFEAARGAATKAGAESGAASGVPAVVERRGSPDESAPASATQESREVTVDDRDAGTPVTEVQMREEAAKQKEPERGASFAQLAAATRYTDIVELANTLNSAVVTFETRLTPEPGFATVEAPRGTKTIIHRLHELVDDVRGLIDAPEEQHKGQKKDRIERDIVE